MKPPPMMGQSATGDVIRKVPVQAAEVNDAVTAA